MSYDTVADVIGQQASEAANQAEAIWDTAVWLLDEKEGDPLATLLQLRDMIHEARGDEEKYGDVVTSWFYSFVFGHVDHGFVDINSPEGQTILAEIDGDT